MKANCKICNKEFEKKAHNAKLCGDKSCFYENQNANRRVEYEFFDCKYCNKPLPLNRHKLKKFCHDVCKSRYQTKLAKNKTVSKICEWCNGTFETSRTNQTVCDRYCRTDLENKIKSDKNPRKHTHCVECGDKLEGKQSKYCYKHKKDIVKTEFSPVCLFCNCKIEKPKIKFCCPNHGNRYAKGDTYREIVRTEPKPITPKKPKKKKVYTAIVEPKPIKLQDKPRLKICECGKTFKGLEADFKCMPCKMKTNKKEVHHDY